MKKLIFSLCLALLLVGCTAGQNTPIVFDDYKLDAAYTVGDFSFDCRVIYHDSVVTFVPTSTKASGMHITCDGATVTYDRNGMVRSFDTKAVSPFNPALVLYQVFSSLSTASADRVENCYHLTGKTSIGDYSLILSLDGYPLSLTVPNADISVDFAN